MFLVFFRFILWSLAMLKKGLLQRIQRCGVIFVTAEASSWFTLLYMLGMLISICMDVVLWMNGSAPTHRREPCSPASGTAQGGVYARGLGSAGPVLSAVLELESRRTRARKKDGRPLGSCRSKINFSAHQIHQAAAIIRCQGHWPFPWACRHPWPMVRSARGREGT